MAVSEKIERVSTGVSGVDRLIGGGLPAGSIFLVAGGPGTGKTIFALHFASAGVERNEIVVYVCMEQEIEDVKKQAQQLGIDVSRAIFVSAQKLSYGMGKKPEDMDEVVKLLLETVTSYRPLRVVVDPINSLGLEGGLKSRLLTKKLVDGLRKTKATTILVGEAIDGSYADTVTPYTCLLYTSPSPRD